MTKIAEALKVVFKKHRIVFWYDSKKELRKDYEELEFSGIEKIELNNNEFRVKHRILREEPDKKFLLYHEGEAPSDLDNWLLDVQLASEEFRTDQSAIWLNELGLGMEFTDIVNDHVVFFNAAKRRENLKKILSSDDTQNAVRVKIIAVCAASDPRIDDILENLFTESAVKKDEKLKLIENCGLEEFLWNRLELSFGYTSDSPGLRDFIIQLFKSCYDMSLGDDSELNPDALVFLKRWKDSVKHQKAFETLSKECADILTIEKDLQKRDISSLEEIDFFELVDRKILSDLVKNVVDQTISTGDREGLIRQRKLSHWYKKYMDLYQAIDYGARFIKSLEEAELNIESMDDGLTKYTNYWYLLDQLYRKYIFHTKQSGQVSMLKALSDKVENLYSNNYLLPVNNNWQNHIDQCDNWGKTNIEFQRHFFRRQVCPFLNDKKKMFVIISDALRYEIGHELHSRIRQEDRFDAEITPMLSTLPSFTQLGMASLLPNKEILFSDDHSTTVFVDGKSTQGTENRSKILQDAVKGAAKAMRADELMGMNKTECRELFKEHDVVYVYHNQIDATGDKKESEGRVFDAVEDTLEELIKIIKKLVAANATNLLVTSDHGFIYQDRVLEDSDFLGADITGIDALHRDRRFLLGKGLPQNTGMKSLTAKEAGIEGDMEIQIPKSINRLRLKGSGSRFVHGGASLQEVVIPVIKIHKKRQSDVSKVGIDILGGSTSFITTGQFSVTFYQAQQVTDKVQSRTLRAGIYSKDNELISDSHNLNFEFVSGNPRERELKIRFVLTKKADDLNEQEVYLRLEEQEPGTAYYKEYKSTRYVIRRSFTSDFDF
ncbi:BREX-1 system phosphatase PglZ type A [Desulfobacula sp.]|uniref:BREX-1 system phosphatase PglZ type A n=1 Tax=Desulfobacula sp. TaxID=2593537 RepID=UPI0039B8521D|nr:BREX-1 system phosphatase PglZ type A [Desulfobacula sp.]MBT7628747.1 BREX-1 system phosphatase PglZ type A [Desulfobacula sp.]